ncbi:MAG: DNRLRE domain-containing protein [Gammaproteobacteria bacterium]|nr:DNRLRE domain-containing protein [Gammaproteobacteria bacterium]
MSPNQSGIAVVSVLVFLLVIAAVVALRGGEELGEIQLAAADAEARRIDYAAQAGLQHALWRARESACQGDFTIPPTAIGPDTYSATTSGGGNSSFYTLTVDQDAWVRSDNTGQNNGNTNDLHTRFENGKIEQSLVRFDLSPIPANARINSASVFFYVELNKEHPEGSITLHRITADWAENAVTWDSFNSGYDAVPLGMIPAQDTGAVWVRVNITGQVQAWVNGQPNYGILLNSVAEGVHAEYTSKEGAGNQQPRLEVVVGNTPVTPLSIQADGTLANGKTRTITRPSAIAYQVPSEYGVTSGDGTGQDAMIKQDLWGNNLGANEDLWVQDTSGGNGDHALLQFDLSGIPQGARIIDATLSLYQHWNGTPGGTVGVHRLTRDWDEGTQVNGPGDGATWVTYDWFAWWTNSGGDFEAEASATTDIPPGGVGRHEWELASLVDGWVQGRYPNYGFILTPDSPGADMGFYSSDIADSTLHPRLTVTYSCACGTACLAPRGSGKIALIGDDNSPNSDDQLRIQLFESWGYEVDFYEDLDSDTINWSNYDLAYISETAVSGDVSANVANIPIGVVNEEPNLYDDFELAGDGTEHVGSSIDITDTSHYITAIFQQGALSIYNADMEILTANTPLAGGLQTLGQYNGQASLTATDAGAATTSGTAAGRRVTLPLGQHVQANFTWTQLNNNAHLLVQRAMAWAMNADFVSIGNLLMVVGNDGNLTDQEDQKKALIESWGYTVSVIDEDDNQGEFDTALAANDVVFITEDVNDGDLGNKLANATIGVVTEEVNQADNLGFDTNPDWDSGTSINIVDNSHYITQPFSTGNLTVLNTSESLGFTDGTSAPDMIILGTVSGEPSVAALEAGASIIGGGTAAGRRVLLPWGGNNMDVNYLNDDGLTIFRRSLEWARGATMPGPIAHWMFDETSGTIADDAIGNNDGTLIDGPVWAQGIKDGGLRFDGVDDRVDAGTFDVTGSGITMVGWFNADVISTSDPRIISKANSTAVQGARWQLSTSNSGSNRYLRMRLKAGGTTDELIDTTTNLTPGQWYFAAGTYNAASGRMTLYLNGVEIASTNHAVGGPVDTDPTVSVEIGSNGTAERFFDGILDDVRVYDRPLSATEIAELAVIPTPEPIAHWMLNDGAGTTAIDSVGGNDGTLYNGPSWVAGSLGDALEFDGNNDRVTTNSNFTPPSAGTVSFWMQVDGPPGAHGRILGLHDTWEIRHVTTGTPDGIPYGLVFDLGVSGVNTEFVTTTTIDNPGQWYHIAASYDTATDAYAVYIDGVPHTSGIYSSPLSMPSAAPLSLGTRTGSSNNYDGKLDDVRIYDRVLTPAQIADLAAGGGGGGGCSGNFRDEFNARSWDGDDGTLGWSTDWVEVGESDGPTSGDTRITNDTSNYQLRTKDNDNGGEGVEREVDLTGATTVTLTYDYRRESLDNSNDYTAVLVSANGASGPWTELTRHQGGGTDSSYQPASHDISGSISGNTRIRFRTSSNMGGSDIVWFDNIEISCGP